MRIGKVQYNGVSSDTLGVFVSGSGSYDAAEFDVTNYQVPGRNGDILIPNNRYKNIDITYPCFIPSDFETRVQAVRNWMRSARSYARIEDNYDLLHYRMGIGKGVLKFSPAQQSIGANAQLVFNCKPQRFLKSGETEQNVVVVPHSFSGAVVDFETTEVKSLSKAEVTISPSQSFNGYASPWPPGGGTNKFDIDTIGIEQGAVSSGTGGNSSSTTRCRTIGYVPVSPNTEYTLTVSITGQTSPRVYVLQYSGQNMSYYLNVSSGWKPNEYTFTTDASATYLRFVFANASDTTITASDVQAVMLELGHTPSAWSPYTNICPITGISGTDITVSDTNGSGGTTYTVTFTDQGTIYGGKYDFVSGTLTVTQATIASYNGETIGTPWISSYEVYAVGTTPTTGAQVVYPLNTPQTYTITGEQIDSLLGQNYIWSSDGNVAVLYYDPFTTNNPTQYEAKPILKLENPLTGAVINVNAFTITATTSYTGVVEIDCESQNIYSGDTNLNSIFTVSNFPVLGEGKNVITFSDADSLKIVPRWWEL